VEVVSQLSVVITSKMFLNTETLIYVHKSLKIAQWFGVLGFVSVMDTTRRVKMNTSIRFRLHSWLNTVIGYCALYLVSTCLYVTAYLKFVKGLLPYSFLIFWIGFFIVVLLSILMDYASRNNAILLQNLINSNIHITEIADRKF